MSDFETKRTKTAKEVFFSHVPEICLERADIITRVYKENEDLPIALKRAKALDEILENMSIFIQDYELLVGNIASKPRSTPVFPEFTVHYIKEEIDDFSKRPGDRLKISSENKKKLLDLIKYWEGKTVRDLNLSMLPLYTIHAGEDGVGAIDSDWVLQNGDGHIAVDYEKLIKFGLKENIDFCKRQLQNLEVWDDPENIYKRLFYQSVITTNNAVIKFAKRYSALAKQKAKIEKDEVRRLELEKIADVCNHVPENPARNFWEGLQSILFVQFALQVETNAHSISIGRFDQFMYPLYKKDIGENIIDDQSALELIQLFRIKLNEVLKLKSRLCTEFFRGFPMFQNLTIGGQTLDKEDASNELTFIFLEATKNLKLYQPSLTARVAKVSSDEYLDKCSEVISTGGGFPAMFNDDIIVPSLVKRGVKEEDALDYCMIGCVEPTVQGKWGGRYGACFINLVKILELAINGGKDPRTGLELKKGSGDLSTFENFEELMDAYKSQVDYYTKQQVIKDNVQDYCWEELIPTPLCSSLISDCLERGKEIKKGGAIYDFTGGQTGGIANLANSLAAIKKLVFEEKLITGKELLELLKNNFEGKRGEEIRQIILNKVPKYGNDEKYVDSIARDSFSAFLKGVDKYKNTRFGRGPIGCSWHPSTASVSANVPMGFIVGATPDGRKAGEPLADVESATHGTDKKGVTAMLKSASRIEHIYMSGGSLLNLRLAESLFK
jgi:formate C-acetyltransferase